MISAKIGLELLGSFFILMGLAIMAFAILIISDGKIKGKQVVPEIYLKGFEMIGSPMFLRSFGKKFSRIVMGAFLIMPTGLIFIYLGGYLFNLWQVN